MPILAESIVTYLAGLRPEERSEVMLEMEALAEREHIPIVHWQTGRLLAVLAKAIGATRIVEVGTAIGYSTLHMALGAPEATIVTLERDSNRIAQATEFLRRGGVADRVEIVEGDALASLESLGGRFDLAFVDATKKEYPEYLRALERTLAPGALVAVDNVLMSGEVSEPEGAETFWAADALATARTLNAELVGSDEWLAAVLPVGDGVALAVRR